MKVCQVCGHHSSRISQKKKDRKLLAQRTAEDVRIVKLSVVKLR